MILIIGTSKDDILYFDSRIRNRREELIFEKHTIVLGTILGQDVCIAYDNHTNYMSSVITSYLINKYSPILVINAGMCRSYSDDLNPGDIVIARRIYLGDVNQLELGRVQISQIPYMPQFYPCDINALNIFNKMKDRLVFKNIYLGTDVSASDFYHIKENLDLININGVFFGQNEKVIVDSEAGGIAVTCKFYGIPFISIKVIMFKLGEGTYDRLSLVNAIRHYPNVGKLVSAVIGEIANSDALMLTMQNNGGH